MVGPLAASSCESLTLLTLPAFPHPRRATLSAQIAGNLNPINRRRRGTVSPRSLTCTTRERMARPQWSLTFHKVAKMNWAPDMLRRPNASCGADAGLHPRLAGSSASESPVNRCSAGDGNRVNSRRRLGAGATAFWGRGRNEYGGGWSLKVQLRCGSSDVGRGAKPMTVMYAQGDLLIERVDDRVPVRDHRLPRRHRCHRSRRGRADRPPPRHLRARDHVPGRCARARRARRPLYRPRQGRGRRQPPSGIRSMRRSRSARAPIASAASASSSPRTPSLLRTEVGALSHGQRAELTVYGARWNALRQSTAPPDHAGVVARRCDKAYAGGGPGRRRARSSGRTARPSSRWPGPSGGTRPATACARSSSTSCAARPSWRSTAPSPSACAWR